MTGAACEAENMIPISLESATKEIWGGGNEEFRDEAKRYFFLTGAGVSAGPLGIPLADEIGKAGRQKLGPDFAEAPYEEVLRRAWPSRGERQRLFQMLDTQSAITPATWRLAQLLLFLPKDVPWIRTVFTVNFDTQLERALTVLGKEFVLCDHGAQVPRVWIGSTDPVQIVHLHGGCWGHDLSNTKAEVQNRDDDPPDSYASLNRLLGGFLHNYSPLVIGYSGNVEDLFSKAIKRSKSTPRRAKIYWFQFSPARLPKCCHGHQDLELVQGNVERDEIVDKEYLRDLCATLETRYGVSLDPDAPRKLPAIEVFESLLRMGLDHEVPRFRPKLARLIVRDEGWEKARSEEILKEQVFGFDRSLGLEGADEIEDDPPPVPRQGTSLGKSSAGSGKTSDQFLIVEERVAKGDYLTAMKQLIECVADDDTSLEQARAIKVFAQISLFYRVPEAGTREIESYAGNEDLPLPLRRITLALLIGIRNRAGALVEALDAWNVLVKIESGEKERCEAQFEIDDSPTNKEKVARAEEECHFAQLGVEFTNALMNSWSESTAVCKAPPDWKVMMRTRRFSERHEPSFELRKWREAVAAGAARIDGAADGVDDIAEEERNE